MTTAAATSPKISGGAFLIEEFSPDEVFTAEDLSEEHLAIARTVDEFWANDVEPHLADDDLGGVKVNLFINGRHNTVFKQFGDKL